MPTSLVIVESPAKARTIARFLGDDFVVEASIGAIRDLDPKGLAVDIDDDFKPTYVVPPVKRDVVKRLKAALKSADNVYLATDEDREGEAIAWHLAEVLQPRVPMRRMVFHEITRQAIENAVERSRDINTGLVDAQEARRIVDRLYGYPVSQVLWRKIAPRLSAGRVQSPAVRLVVERKRERMAFLAADYWDLSAAFPTDPRFAATLVGLDGRRVATGKDFDSQGRVAREDVAVLDETAARGLVTALDGSTFTVRSVEEKPYRSSPKPPFITSTLQQEGGRKLGLSSAQVMRSAQGLYERGYITYMRTDSVTLSNEAIAAARRQVTELYGPRFVPDRPRHYRSKVKNAQEAHEAIRPAGDRWRTPDQLRGELNATDLRLYDLIWKRTLASQMADATGKSVSVRIEGPRQPDPAIDPSGHTTQPPARYTEASLVKKLEELGIGRPSTYASIMGTIQDRGYVWKKGQALVPSWTAFAVINLLEGHFSAEVDYQFTARMENDLDEIATGERDRVPFLRSFWFGTNAAIDSVDGNGHAGGNGQGTGGGPGGGGASGTGGSGGGGNGARVAIDESPGLTTLIDYAMANADPAVVNAIPLGKDDTGEEVVVRNGRYGPYVRRGEATATIPDEIAPDDLTVERALELLAAPKGDDPIGTDPATNLPVYVKNGRYGPYVQLGDAETLPEGEKPKMASLFKTMTPTEVGLEDAVRLPTLPRVVGEDRESGEPIEALNGRYGPYIRKGSDTRSLTDEEQIFSVTLDEAVRLFAEPKRRGRQA